MIEISYKRILLIAVPLMLGTFVQSIVMLTDSAFVARLGPIQFNAVNNAGLIYVSLFMFCKGLADGSQILIARKYGEGNIAEIGRYIIHTQFLQVFLSGLLFVIFYFFSAYFIRDIVNSHETGTEMIEFLRYRSWGIFFAGMQASLVGFFIGIGKTGIVLISTLVLALGNVLLDYLLIFGHAGLPEMGMAGAPLASSISEMLAFIVILWYFLISTKFELFRSSLWQKLNMPYFTELAKISIPLMLQGFLALSGWLLFFTLIEREMTSHDLEVSSTIRAIYFLAFVPMFGFGSTTRTYVSNLVGAKKMHLIPIVQKRIILLCMFFVVIMFHGAILYPEQYIKIIDNNPAILSDASKVFTLICGSFFFFSIVIVYFNSVAAVGKSNITFLIEVVSIIAYLVFAYLFIVTWRFDVTLIWWVEYIYFGVMGALSYFYFVFYKRKFVA
jgi:multidrug resistance protein, MATE family